MLRHKRKDKGAKTAGAEGTVSGISRMVCVWGGGGRGAVVEDCNKVEVFSLPFKDASMNNEPMIDKIRWGLFTNSVQVDDNDNN